VSAPPAETDAVLLARFRAGDADALAALYTRHEQAVFHFLLGMLRHPHDAEDALQETFIQALRKSDSVTDDKLRGWLFAVAHQQAVLLKRRAKRRPELASAAVLHSWLGIDDPVAAGESADTAAALHGLLDRLPAAQQAVIRLRIFEGLRFREVAERVGCPLGTALARMHEGLKTLRLLWDARYATA
jgi:RNA polymerase sigma-70 factor (ECF subfamily)